MEQLAIMRPAALGAPVTHQPIVYDAIQRRLWIMGQRCHHGATGALLAASILTGAALGHTHPRRSIALAGAGTLLMAHDWKDRSIWFEPGHGSQP